MNAPLTRPEARLAHDLPLPDEDHEGDPVAIFGWVLLNVLLGLIGVVASWGLA